MPEHRDPRTKKNPNLGPIRTGGPESGALDDKKLVILCPSCSFK